MKQFTDTERREFLAAHIPHRLTALLSCSRRLQADPAFYQGRGDVYCASVEGAFIMLRVFIEFLGIQSARPNGMIQLVQRKRQATGKLRSARDTDVMLDCFGLPLATPADFDPEQDLIARVHDGLSKATAHFTFQTNHFFDSARDFGAAVDKVLCVLQLRFFGPLGEQAAVHVDLPR